MAVMASWLIQGLNLHSHPLNYFTVDDRADRNQSVSFTSKDVMTVQWTDRPNVWIYFAYLNIQMNHQSHPGYISCSKMKVSQALLRQTLSVLPSSPRRSLNIKAFVIPLSLTERTANVIHHWDRLMARALSEQIHIQDWAFMYWH